MSIIYSDQAPAGLRLERPVPWEQQRADLNREIRELERENDLLRQEQKVDRHKLVNTVLFDVKVKTVDAHRFADMLKSMYGSAQERTMRVIAGEFLEGGVLWCHMAYGPVRGAHPADVRRALGRVAKASGVKILEDPCITVLEREYDV